SFTAALYRTKPHPRRWRPSCWRSQQEVRMGAPRLLAVLALVLAMLSAVTGMPPWVPVVLPVRLVPIGGGFRAPLRQRQPPGGRPREWSARGEVLRGAPGWFAVLALVRAMLSAVTVLPLWFPIVRLSLPTLMREVSRLKNRQRQQHNRNPQRHPRHRRQHRQHE